MSKSLLDLLSSTDFAAAAEAAKSRDELPPAGDYEGSIELFRVRPLNSGTGHSVSAQIRLVNNPAYNGKCLFIGGTLSDTREGDGYQKAVAIATEQIGLLCRQCGVDKPSVSADDKGNVVFGQNMVGKAVILRVYERADGTRGVTANA